MKNLYFAEIAQILVRNTNYEIPALRKLISKTNTQIQENERKESEYMDTISVYKLKFKQACAELNIPGSNVRNELKGSVTELQKVYEDTIKSVQTDKMKDGINFYRSFVTYILNTATTTEEKKETNLNL